MNFCPGSKNSIIGKTLRKPQDDRIIIDKNWVNVS
jgi:hypothetical protein